MTEQIGERLLFEGEELWVLPRLAPPLPRGHSRLVEAIGDELDLENDIQVLEADPVDPWWIGPSSACARGYVGTWEIREGRLNLVDVRGYYKLVGETPLLADWFSGTLQIPRGGLVFTIEAGIVVHTTTVGTSGGPDRLVSDVLLPDSWVAEEDDGLDEDIGEDPIDGHELRPKSDAPPTSEEADDDVPF